MTASAVPDSAAETAWRAAVANVLKGDDFDSRLVTRTLDGIPIRPLYPAADATGPAGARAPCRIFARLDSDELPPLDEVENGADGLVLVFDGAPTARGFGLAPGALGSVLEGIELDLLPLRLEPAPFRDLETVQALLEVADARRIPASSLDLDAGIDPVGSMARTGETPRPWTGLAAELLEAVSLFRDSGLSGPLLRADGRPHHEAGASEAQELAGVLATAVAYLRTLDTGGLAPGAGREALSFQLAADADLFMTIAKLRALRRLWARVEEACGLESRPIRLQVETSWRMLARRDPPTNLLRNTLACVGATLGDADGVTVLPHTAPLGLTDLSARRLSRNTALVLRDEAGLDRVADPGAGSGAIEAMTGALCCEAWDILRVVEEAGGLPSALADGSWALRLTVAQDRRVAELMSGRRAILGTTAFSLVEEPAPAVLRSLPAAPPPPVGALLCLRDDQLVEGLTMPGAGT